MKTNIGEPLILIPARMASTRLPGKPLLGVGGAPMIVQVWRRAMESKLGPVVVACDGEEIAEAIIAAGGKTIITDPDLPSGSDRIYAALCEFDKDGRHDIVINLQGDVPTIEPELLHKAAFLLKDTSIDIGTLAAPIESEEEKRDTAVVKVAMAQNGRALYFSRSTIPHGEGVLYQHIGIYAYRRPALERFVKLAPSPLEKREKLEQLRALENGMAIGVAVVKNGPVGVDTPETLTQARKYYER